MARSTLTPQAAIDANGRAVTNAALPSLFELSSRGVTPRPALLWYADATSTTAIPLRTDATGSIQQDNGLPFYTDSTGLYVEFGFNAQGKPAGTTLPLQAELGSGGGSGAGIIDGSVVTTKLADASVTGAKIASASVTAAKLATSSVTSAAIADGAIVTVDLAPGAVTAAKTAGIFDATSGKLLDTLAPAISQEVLTSADTAARLARTDVTVGKTVIQLNDGSQWLLKVLPGSTAGNWLQVGTVGSSAVVAATQTAPGVVQLAGDLAGSSTAPTVPGLLAKVNISALLLAQARAPESYCQGNLTNDPGLGTIGSSQFAWADSATGAWSTTLDASSRVSTYAVTHVLSSVTTTYTQPPLTYADPGGAGTDVDPSVKPAITVA